MLALTKSRFPLATWRCFSFFDRFKSKSAVHVERIKNDKYREAIRFMQRNYLDDPFLRAIGIFYRHRETRNFLTALWTVLLKSDMSLAVVYDKEIRGLSINYPRSYKEGTLSCDTFRRLARIVKTDATRSLLLAWDKIDTEVSKAVTPGMDRMIRTLELAGLAVDSQFRQQGIGKHLIQSSAELALKLGYDYIRIDCTNAAMSRICERMGWNKIWELPFETFHGYVPDAYGFSEKEIQRIKVFLQPVNTTLALK